MIPKDQYEHYSKFKREQLPPVVVADLEEYEADATRQAIEKARADRRSSPRFMIYERVMVWLSEQDDLISANIGIEHDTLPEWLLIRIAVRFVSDPERFFKISHTVSTDAMRPSNGGPEFVAESIVDGFHHELNKTREVIGATIVKRERQREAFFKNS